MGDKNYCMRQNYTVSQKVPNFKLSIILSNLNKFYKIFVLLESV